jgi:hypothetical protein
LISHVPRTVGCAASATADGDAASPAAAATAPNPLSTCRLLTTLSIAIVPLDRDPTPRA